MELLADENIPRPIIERLRKDGWNVVALVEHGPGLSDENVVFEARERGSVLVTQDQDFSELVFFDRVAVAGVVVLELARLSIRQQIERLAESLAAEKHGLMGHLTVIEPTRTRRRPLPPS